MKSTDLFVSRPTTKKIEWESDPSIGWFMESNPFRVYYGAPKDEVANILENGIFADDDGYVKCALEPYTAHYQAMPLTESCENDKRVVFIVDIPTNYSIKNPVYTEDARVTDKELYENWGKSDAEYYALAEVCIPKHIPVTCIKGYMIKNDS